MTITITVETGAVVTGANSFVSLVDWKAWADQRGYSYSTYSDEVIKAKIIQAADYANGQDWKGYPTNRTNPMSWPRYGDETGGNPKNVWETQATIYVGVLDGDGFYIGLDEVPGEVVSGQCEAAWLLLQGKVLEPVQDRGGMIKRKRIEGAVEVEYATGAPSNTRYVSISSRWSGLLKSIGHAKIQRG